jgi:hypothetical protein
MILNCNDIEETIVMDSKKKAWMKTLLEKKAKTLKKAHERLSGYYKKHPEYLYVNTTKLFKKSDDTLIPEANSVGKALTDLVDTMNMLINTKGVSVDDCLKITSPILS